MTLPSCREIRNQLFIVVGAATAVLATTSVVLDANKSFADIVADANPTSSPLKIEEVAQEISDEFAPIVTRTQVNWDDVNLTGPMVVPEDEVKTARSKILGDFEAR